MYSDYTGNQIMKSKASWLMLLTLSLLLDSRHRVVFYKKSRYETLLLCQTKCVTVGLSLSGTSCVSRGKSRQVVPGALWAHLNPPCTWQWWPAGRGWRRLSPWLSLQCFSVSNASTCTSLLKTSCMPASWKQWVQSNVQSLLFMSCCWRWMAASHPTNEVKCNVFVPVGVLAWFYSLQVQVYCLHHQLPQWERSWMEEAFQTLRLSEAFLTCEFLMETRHFRISFVSKKHNLS